MATEQIPPHKIPDNLYDKFTLFNSIPVAYKYYNNCVAHGIHITSKKYEETFERLNNGTFSYYGDNHLQFYDAFNQYALSGKTVLIWGFAGCNCDAMALWQHAEQVYVVDYNKPICEHEKVTSLTHEELRQSRLTCDYAISFSSFEHSGLGRYGDPLDPSADLQAMRTAYEYLKDDGILMLGVPLGQDALIWNAHRIYGPQRLPLLLQGWKVVDVYSTYKGNDIFKESFGVYAQPLLILKKNFQSKEDCFTKNTSIANIITSFQDQHDQRKQDEIIFNKHFRDKHVEKEHYQFIVSHKAPHRIKIARTQDVIEKMKKFFEIIRPYKISDLDMVRIGGQGDGGYVMADPGHNGIAYSFGVSSYAPWDLEMANRGFKVFQYDGTIDAPPNLHPNMHFFKNNVSGLPVPPPGEKTIQQIFSENGHDSNTNIVLQCDIEGAEWDLFENMSPLELSKFKQIIVEFHSLDPHQDRFQRYLKILQKINQTHVSVHVHFNNHSSITYIPGHVMLGTLLEITYIRNDNCAFAPNCGYYPTILDKLNTLRFTDKDIPIGYFGDIVPIDRNFNNYKRSNIKNILEITMQHFELDKIDHIASMETIIQNLHELHEIKTQIEDQKCSSIFSEEQVAIINKFKEIFTLEQIASLPKKYKYGPIRFYKNANAKRPPALFVKRAGRFGNNFMQLLAAIYICKKLNINTLIADIFPQFKTGKHKFGDLIINFTNTEKEKNYKEVIKSSFYFTLFNLNRKQHPDFYNLDHENSISSIISFLDSLLTIKVPNERVKDNDLVVQLRSGDIFDLNPHPNYAQPPYAYYEKAINMHRSEYKNSTIYLVFEDRGNPCIEKIEKFLQKNRIRYYTQSSTLSEDYSFFLNSSHIVAARGSFIFPAIAINKKIRKIYWPNKGDNLFLTTNPHIEIIHICPSDQYLNKMKLWVNSEEQRQLMLTHSEFIIETK